MIKHVHVVRCRRSGKPPAWYVYAFRGGPCVLKTHSEKRPRLDPQVLQAIADAQAARYACDPTILQALIREWRRSAEWERLAATTRKTWGSQLDVVEQKWGETPLAFWNDPRMVAKVVAWRDSRADTPRAADIGVTVLRTLLEFARLRGRLTMNAAQNILPSIAMANAPRSFGSMTSSNGSFERPANWARPTSPTERGLQR